MFPNCYYQISNLPATKINADSHYTNSLKTCLFNWWNTDCIGALENQPNHIVRKIHIFWIWIFLLYLYGHSRHYYQRICREFNPRLLDASWHRFKLQQKKSRSVPISMRYTCHITYHTIQKLPARQSYDTNCWMHSCNANMEVNLYKNRMLSFST